MEEEAVRDRGLHEHETKRGDKDDAEVDVCSFSVSFGIRATGFAEQSSDAPTPDACR